MLLLNLIAVSSWALVANASCYKGYTSKFSFNAGKRSNADWMKGIPDETFLTSLSIPGTHDTMTYDIRDQVFQCQNRNLSTQLNAGLRYFDIRGRLVNNFLDIYHSTEYTGYSYTDVLLDFFEFLDKNPSETIVMRLKQESQAINSTMSFEEAFLHYLWNDTATASGAQKHLYLLPQGQAYAPIPRLGSLRGKIFILQNFPSQVPNRYGIGWESSDMILQDLWEIENVNSLWKKWDAIKKSLIDAATIPDDNRAIFLSHLSASVGLLPIEAAAGPLNRTVVGMNDETGEYLLDVADAGKNDRTGILITDFPGQDLIDLVLSHNDHFRSD